MRIIRPGYYLIAEYGNYAVIQRETNYQPFVVANGLHKDGTWDYGHYFNDLFDAVDYAKSKADERHISYDRMKRIAIMAIDEIFRYDENDALDYCEKQIEMSEEEMRSFSISRDDL